MRQAVSLTHKSKKAHLPGGPFSQRTSCTTGGTVIRHPGATDGTRSNIILIVLARNVNSGVTRCRWRFLLRLPVVNTFSTSDVSRRDHMSATREDWGNSL